MSEEIADVEYLACKLSRRARTPRVSREYADDHQLEEVVDSKTGDSQSGPGNGESVPTKRRRTTITRAIAYGVFPAVIMGLAGVTGYVKWKVFSAQADQAAGSQAVQAARDGTVALLGYQADTVEKDLAAARERLTGEFRDSFTTLVNDVVIPGSRQKHISAVAEVPAAALIWASRDRASVLVFVNQTATVAAEPPSKSTSTVKVTLVKADNHWLISGFDPV